MERRSADEHTSPSVADRVTAMGDAGGVNRYVPQTYPRKANTEPFTSFNNFARSWQRAAVFPEFIGGRQSFLSPPADGIANEDVERRSHGRTTLPHRSLLRAALESEQRGIPENPIVDDAERYEESAPPPLSSVERRLSERRSSPQRPSFIAIDPGLASPFAGSYGAFASRFDEAAIARRVPEIVHPDRSRQSDDENEPLLIKQTESQEEPKVPFVVGQSTVPQTMFNSVNILIGVGMLSLPLALKYSGWIFGVIFFALASLITSYTAKLLAKCLSVDATLITFADLAYISFGTRARVAVSLLFCLELVASCVALIILFADTMHALAPTVDHLHYKIICGIAVSPLAYMPLRFLSVSSVLGIVCCLTIVVGIIVDGAVKADPPGSLRHPGSTTLGPLDWRALPLAYGLLMAPWGGHGVFPNIYRDMRHPMKYNKAVNYTYSFTFPLELIIASIGFAMFGEAVEDEVTSNIFKSTGYPVWISYVIAIAVCIIPLTKIPLNARPIYSTAEFFLGLTTPPSRNPIGQRRSRAARPILIAVIRLVLTVLFVLIAVMVPSFDRVMAMLGSLACSLVCVVLPCSFHLKIFGNQLSRKQKIGDVLLIAVFLVAGVLGTVCACLPKDWLGVD